MKVMIMEIWLKKNNFWFFFVLPFFQKKHKIKQSRDQNDFLINDENTKSKKP